MKESHRACRYLKSCDQLHVYVGRDRFKRQLRCSFYQRLCFSKSVAQRGCEDYIVATRSLELQLYSPMLYNYLSTSELACARDFRPGPVTFLRVIEKGAGLGTRLPIMYSVYQTSDVAVCTGLAVRWPGWRTWGPRAGEGTCRSALTSRRCSDRNSRET